MIKNIGLIGIMVIGSCVGPCRSPQTNTTPAQVAADAPDLQNDEALQRECSILFKSILSIQDNRELRRVQFEQIHKAFNEEKIPHEKFSVARMIWLDEENTLATEAANKYALGRDKGCFQKVTQ
jgi:hypothetical protein